MKKLYFSFAVLAILSLACGTQKKNDNANKSEQALGAEKGDKLAVATNYFDLPKAQAKKLKDLMETKDLSIIKGENIQALHEYLARNLLGVANPNYAHIDGNYFWYIYNALPAFVSEKERHAGYYVGEGNHSDNQKLIAYSLYRIDRSAENIAKVFGYFKPKLKSVVSQSIYDRLGIGLKVNTLIGCYDEISHKKDFEIKLEEAFAEAETAKENAGGAYGYSASDLSENIAKRMGIDVMASFYSDPALSFWMRRNHEGNMQTVYNILTEIQAIYANLD